MEEHDSAITKTQKESVKRWLSINFDPSHAGYKAIKESLQKGDFKTVTKITGIVLKKEKKKHDFNVHGFTTLSSPCVDKKSSREFETLRVSRD